MTKRCKAVQIGGPSIGCIPPSMLDLAIDSVDVPGKSANMGTGGIIVMDSDSCVVDMTRFSARVFRRRIVRPVRALPRGHEADVPSAQPDLRGRRNVGIISKNLSGSAGP